MIHFRSKMYGEDKLSDIGFIIGNAVVGRYVKSLYDVSRKNNLEEEYVKQIEAVKQFVGKIPDRAKILKRLTLLSYREIAFVENMIKELSLVAEIGNFLKLLLKNRRFNLLPEICKAYISFVDAKRGKKVFCVKYAKQFSDEDKIKLQKELSEIFSGDIECIASKDESLIDGIQIRYRSKVLDYSMKSKLLRLEDAIKGDRNEY